MGVAENVGQRRIRKDAGLRPEHAAAGAPNRRPQIKRAVDKKVEEMHECKFKNYPNAVDQVQNMPLWRTLPDPLPWLPQYATSGEALDAAVAAAMPRRSRSS